MTHGLSTETVAAIHSVLARFPEVRSAVLYGSRAKGNFKPGSDIDLSLIGDKLTNSHLADIADQLDDLFLPYTLDLSLFATLDQAELRDHIQRIGIVFYERAAVI